MLHNLVSGILSLYMIMTLIPDKKNYEVLKSVMCDVIKIRLKRRDARDKIKAPSRIW